jgi:hypothetical protein
MPLHQVREDGPWPEDYKIFPSYLFTTLEDREAALSFLGCTDAVEWMVEFVGDLLSVMWLH